jgi:hypothetical protein
LIIFFNFFFINTAPINYVAKCPTQACTIPASDEEGEGGKAMARMTRVAGEQQERQQRGQWQWQQGWWARMRAMARAARAMVMAQRRQLQGRGQW